MPLTAFRKTHNYNHLDFRMARALTADLYEVKEKEFTVTINTSPLCIVYSSQMGNDRPTPLGER